MKIRSSVLASLVATGAVLIGIASTWAQELYTTQQDFTGWSDNSGNVNFTPAPTVHLVPTVPPPMAWEIPVALAEQGPVVPSLKQELVAAITTFFTRKAPAARPSLRRLVPAITVALATPQLQE